MSTRFHHSKVNTLPKGQSLMLGGRGRGWVGGSDWQLSCIHVQSRKLRSYKGFWWANSPASRMLQNNRPRRNIKVVQRKKNETRDQLSWKFTYTPVFSSGSNNKKERHLLWIFEGIKRRILASYYHINNSMCNTVLQPGYKTPLAALLTLTFALHCIFITWR